jgi:tryptophan synthase alpha chain
MNISDTFRELKKCGDGALIAYITGGDPTPTLTPKLAEALFKGGADIIEIGVPFSDPIADGPTIQAANCRALNAGTTPPAIFNIVEETKKRVDAPIVLLSYYNILFKMGVETFLEKASRCGVDGLIIPDLPIEEAECYKEIAENQGVDTIFLAAPSTSSSRLKQILGFTSGFLYLISVFGVTGTREQVAQLTTQTVKRLHPYTSMAVPLAVGFGISKPRHVNSILKCGAEGAIVGSAFVNIVEKNLDKPRKMINDISDLAEKLKAVTLKETPTAQAEG